MGDKIRFFGAYKLDTKILIFSECLNVNKFQLYSKDFERISTVLKATQISSSDFQKIHTSNGTWFCLLDDFNVSYLLLTIPIYPISSALRLLKSLQKEIQKCPNYYESDPEYMTKHLGTFALNLMKDFEVDSSSKDTLQNAKENVIQTQLVMQKNIKDMIENNQRAEAVEKKSEDMGKLADTFLCTSTRLRREMWKRKIRNYIVFALLTLAIILTLYFVWFKSD